MATSAEAFVEHVFAQSRQAQINNKLNVRRRPSLQAERVGRLEPGARVAVDRWVKGDKLLSVDRWYRIADRAEFFWSGGASLLEPALQPPQGSAPVVRRRADNTTLPFTVEQIESVFGKFSYVEGPVKGAITITTPDWEVNNLVPLQHPLVVPLAGNHLRVHRLALPHFTAVLDEIESAALGSVLLTCGGTFVARHIGRTTGNALSSHSWGIAIDLNERWNNWDDEPTLPGEHGCLRELVPIFAAHGFAWGGDFTQTKDGMHFELARTDL